MTPRKRGGSKSNGFGSLNFCLFRVDFVIFGGAIVNSRSPVLVIVEIIVFGGLIFGVIAPLFHGEEESPQSQAAACLQVRSRGATPADVAPM